MARLRLTSRQQRRRPKMGSWFLCLVTLSALAWLLGSPQTLLSTSPSTRAAQQYVRYNKRGKQVMHRVERIRLEDLHDLTDDYLVQLQQQQKNNQLSRAQASKGKEVLLEELYRSGIQDIDVATIQMLPLWKEVAAMYYRHNDDEAQCQPIIYGLDKCAEFAKHHATRQSFLATAGLYNTGTNALTYTMRANLLMSGNPHFDGILVQVPWHKHWFLSQRKQHKISYLSNITLENVLPVVTIRDPLSWAQSMCQQPYDVEWTNDPKSRQPTCPSLGQGSGASVRIPKQAGDKTYGNLFDLWNAWYVEYLTSDLDFVMVRHEDLVYCPKKVVAALQACSGATWKEADFVYVMDQAKWEHARTKAQSSRVSAMIKHGHPKGRRIRSITVHDLTQMQQQVNQTLLKMFGYHLPDASILSTH